MTTGTFANGASVSSAGTDLNLTVRRGPTTLTGSATAMRHDSDASTVHRDVSARG